MEQLNKSQHVHCLVENILHYASIKFDALNFIPFMRIDVFNYFKKNIHENKSELHSNRIDRKRNFAILWILFYL